MRKKASWVFTLAALLMILALNGFSRRETPILGEEFDIVIKNGRVMDPGTRTERLADVGIRNGRLCAIVPPGEELKGREVVEARGLVVAPGFIDIHAHEGKSEVVMQAHVLDGVTTMIGGNCGGGPYPLGTYLDKLDQNGSLIHYAGLCGHSTLREQAGVKDRYAAATPKQLEEMVRLAEQEMTAGALGISYGIAYVPGTPYEEMLALARVAAKYGGMTAAHARSGEIGQEGIDSFREMIRLAQDSGIPHEFSHIGSTLGKSDNMDKFLAEMAQARARGVRISADIYSYLATGGAIGSAIADPGFFERQGCRPEDIEVVRAVKIDGKILMEPGSRFKDEAQFYSVREKILSREIPESGMMAHVIAPDKAKLGIGSPFVMCGSDGTPGHPRLAGNFSRFLGYWTREQGVVDLMTALSKTSTQAALFLGLSNKGRIDLGADADVVIFNPATIKDKAGFGQDSMAPPEGIEYVIVNGKITVSRAKLVPGVLAGKTIRRTWAIPGTA